MVAKGSIAKESSVKAAQEIRCYGIYFMAGVVTSQCLREKCVYARYLFVKRIYLREEMDTCRPYIGVLLPRREDEPEIRASINTR